MVDPSIILDIFGISCFEIPRSRSIGSVDTMARRAVRKAHEGSSSARRAVRRLLRFGICSTLVFTFEVHYCSGFIVSDSVDSLFKVFCSASLRISKSVPFFSAIPSSPSESDPSLGPVTAR